MNLSLFLSVVIGSITILTPVFGQERTKNNYTGSWASNSSWSDGSAPANTNIGSTNQNFEINGYISVGSSASPAGLSFQGGHPSLTFTITDTLVVFGNMSFGTDAMTLSVPAGGLLIVFGNLDINNKVDLSSDGNIIITGQLKLTGGQANIDGTGTFYAGAGESGGNSGQGNYNNGAQGEIGDGPPDRSLNADEDLLDDFPNLWNFVECGGACAMPIKLKYVTASISDNETVRLEWVTLSEEGFDKFLVQHSRDGGNFNTIGEVQGAGMDFENLEKHYDFEVKSPFLGINYYRLAAVDIDGSIEFSKIVSVRLSGERQINVFPNPARSGDIIKLHRNFGTAETDYFSIVNQLGVTLFTIPAFNLLEDVTLHNPLPPGSYFIKMSTKEGDYYDRLYVIE